MSYVCIKPGCRRIYEQQPGSCFSCGSDTRRSTGEERKLHRLRELVNSFNKAQEDVAPSAFPHLLYELLSVTFDAGGDHYAAEIRTLRNTCYELINIMQQHLASDTTGRPCRPHVMEGTE